MGRGEGSCHKVHLTCVNLENAIKFCKMWYNILSRVEILVSALNNKLGTASSPNHTHCYNSDNTAVPGSQMLPVYLNSARQS